VTTIVEITVKTENYTTGGYEHVEIAAKGPLATALRSCLLRIGDRFAADPEVQRLVEAVALIPREEA
jgi:hypothetical protein